MRGTEPLPGVLDVIRDLVDKMAPHCDDTETLLRLKELMATKDEMRKAHGIYSHQISPKTQRAIKRGDKQAEWQYLFEGVCAKTIFNLTRSPASFDAGESFWILPYAIAFFRTVGYENVEELPSLLRMQPRDRRIEG